jgi:hypothetical protein
MQGSFTIAVMNDLEVHGFRRAGDREAYVDRCLKKLRTLKGMVPTRPRALCSGADRGGGRSHTMA